MTNNKIAFFLPTRKGSERVVNKNTRVFANIRGGLMENKIRQLTESTIIDEIIVSTNDDCCCEIVNKYAIKDNRIRVIKRPENLCLSSTNLSDLIKYVPTITNANYLMWGHVTTPLIDARQYDSAIEIFFEKLKYGYDSLVGVTEFRNFLLNKSGELINNTTNIQWPRTQDLDPLYEINHTMFIAHRDTYINQINRIGKIPYLYILDKISAFDIDWPEDFKIAECLYSQYVNKRV